MEHVLDNPAWSALLSGNKNLALGTDAVKYFDAEVSPFVGFAENNAESFRALYDMVPGTSPRGFISPVEMKIPAGWRILAKIKCPQMIFGGKATPTGNANIIPLTLEHVPPMLALTKLTNPGPFAQRTIEFGHYTGIFAGDQLVAMAGQRMHAFNYAEISAVCTHPDHLGKGYARQLLLHQAARIQAAGNVPYLHVRDDNERAIKVYEGIGFVTRRHIYFYIIQKQ
ncbi:GNAT family N-acetyltransferase [Mucilaginibacter mali]|uniref:GNAT family N-acetyltransferase n=1 Tax=Mucilaginibacter mali TaxID=2740462 RepID=A0A7D4QHI3_9SPHI|nr:GNAT family N-acetyltransferase [Mucilaginibacter mali]QKJ31992.1 GNAT family N-acetyltransferase [Mucilaginibacter mali]